MTEPDPVWRQVAAAIATHCGRQLPRGCPRALRLELSAEFGIATSTAQKALARLKTEGLVRDAEVGLGSFVAKHPERPAAEDKAE